MTPTRFTLKPQAVGVGDTVELLVVEASSDGAGDFVGAEVKVALTH